MVCFLRLNVGGAYCLLCLSAAVLLTSSRPLSVGLVSKYSCGESEFVHTLNYAPPHEGVV